MATVTIWSDIHCPWAAVAVHRLRAARDRERPGVVFDQRPWPLEFVNREGTPRNTLVQETAVLANHEPALFSAYDNDSWPSSLLPAFELVAAARRVHGLRVAEGVDYALRLAFFRDSVDVSIRAGLEQALKLAAGLSAELDEIAVLDAWDDGAVRADVVADYERSKGLPIQGSPQIFWPDGSTSHNPGMTDHHWVRGIPRIAAADPEEPARLLRTKVAS
ncbi:MAG: DsbA family oxidoreductase [Candidatus Dormibacteraceae bacterium]